MYRLGRVVVFILTVGGVLMSCNSAKSTVEPTAQSEALETLITEKSFRIESDWMYPLMTTSLNSLANSGLVPPGSTINGISLIGNANFVKIHGDSISMKLPFYGERQLPGKYGSNDIGIKFDGIPDRYEVIKNEKKQRHIIKFTVNDDQESYRVTITMFPNWKTSININSTHRTSIRYSGIVMKPDTDKDLVVN
ncbi:DUF4251 domain-containing protein [Aquimarina litoralis]|uniref:DUF4251 domain-containing protein n=1 Tax=Aquimarina litoralis TaxID=584605 RepID=UPI001C561B7D|nr:DUF4251 domain-containing protein [Aquimarina litoralis]MBW1297422.1 DUF4251 domain-containing protein [Aquimarina litoralis]